MDSCGSSHHLIGLVDRKQSTREWIRPQYQGDVLVLSVRMAVTHVAECIKPEANNRLRPHAPLRANAMRSLLTRNEGRP